MSSSPDDSLEAVSLSEVHQSLALFVESIARQPVPIEPCEPIDSWPRGHGNPYDAVAELPTGEVALTREAARRRLRAAALHQSAGVALRSGAVDRQALAAEHLMLPTVFAWFEDLRVDAAVRASYPGAVADLDELLQLGRLHAADPGNDHIVSTIALRCLGGPTPNGRFGAELEAQARTVEAAGATDDHSLSAARAMCRWLTPSGLLVEAPLAPDVDGPETTASGSVPTEGTVDRAEGTDGVLGGQPVDDLALVDSVSSDVEQESGLQVEVPRRPEKLVPSVRTFVYDEWDVRRGAYLPAWCRVVERHLTAGTGGSADVDPVAFINDVRARHADLRRAIRVELERIRSRSLARVHRQFDGEELDIDAALELVADRRSGVPIDDRVHAHRERRRRDVATAFLVDLSASTSTPVEPPEPASYDDDDDPWGSVWATPDPGPPPRRMIDVAIDAVALMSDALGELGDPHAIYGFSGNGRHDVAFQVAKDFDDPVGARTWAATAAMRPMRYTRMGAAIRHAGAKLAATTAATRTLIVLSDGYPQDTDYGEDPRDREHGLHDTARAIAETQNRGLEVFCLTIDPAGHDYLRVMFADDQYLVIDEVEALPEALARAYLGLAG